MPWNHRPEYQALPRPREEFVKLPASLGEKGVKTAGLQPECGFKIVVGEAVPSEWGQKDGAKYYAQSGDDKQGQNPAGEYIFRECIK